MAPTVEVWSVELPGRGWGSEDSLSTFPWRKIVDDLADNVEQLGTVLPTWLLGHSMGSLVAHEVALELERRGSGMPAKLVVAGARPPHRQLHDWEIPASDEQLLAEVDGLYGGVPAAVRGEPELLARFVRVLRADLEFMRAYQAVPSAKLTCPVLALAGDADPSAPPAELSAWAQTTGGGFELATFRGGHFFLHSDLPTVAATLRRGLDV